jgi:hypothetical protein
MEQQMSKSSTGSGLSVGGVIAGILSWMKWHSLGWCIIHAILGWLYVIYYAFTYGF